MRGYLGNQGRNRPNKGQRHGGGNRDGNRDRDGNRLNGPREEPQDFEPFDDDAEIISPAELTQSRSSMNLTELKARPVSGTTCSTPAFMRSLGTVHVFASRSTSSQ